MKIGSYKSDSGASQPAAPPTPAKAVVTALEDSLQRDVDAAEGVAKRTLTYEELLEREGITKEEAYVIRDALLVDLYFSQTVFLTENTSVKFRTRSYHDFIRYHQAVERANPFTVAERDEITMRYFLAASLEAYGGTQFEFPDSADSAAVEKAFEVRLKFISKLPEAVVEVLGRHLHKFDRKIRIVLSEGAVEDF